MNSKDFQTVSWWSGWDPEYIRGQYIKALKNSWIVFTDRHLKWKKYVELYERLKVEKDADKRKLLRRYVLQARREVNRSEDLVIDVLESAR